MILIYILIKGIKKLRFNYLGGSMKYFLIMLLFVSFISRANDEGTDYQPPEEYVDDYKEEVYPEYKDEEYKDEVYPEDQEYKDEPPYYKDEPPIEEEKLDSPAEGAVMGSEEPYETYIDKTEPPLEDYTE